MIKNPTMIAAAKPDHMPQVEKRKLKSADTEMSIFQLIHRHKDIARIDLAKRTGLSEATLSGIVRGLIKKGLVIESGKGSTALGRKPVSLRVCADTAYFLGVDLEWDSVTVVVTNSLEEVVYQVETPTKMMEGRDAVLRRTCKIIAEALQDCRVPKGVIKGIGLAHPGVIDTQNGVVLSYPRPGQMTEWKNVSLKGMLETEFGLPAAIDDHTRMMAVAEKCFGMGASLNDFLFVSVGWGIGATIFINGEAYRGADGFAGELGHMSLDEDGPLCFCGSQGCVETISSGTAIIETVRRAILKGVDSTVSDLAEGALDRISIEMVCRAAMEKDKLASRVLEEAVVHIGAAISSVINLLNPRTIILGGLLFRHAGPLLLEPLRQVVSHRAMEKSAHQIRFMVSELGSNSAAVGSARLISEKVLDRVYEERSQALTRKQVA